jgi:hypothetical protein
MEKRMKSVYLLFSALFASSVVAEPYALDMIAEPEAYLSSSDDVEIALAVSAAPVQISENAAVLVFDGHDYRQARDGSNGFVCLVERAWAGNFNYVGAFWDPQIRSPICYNPHAADYVLPLYMLRTRLALAGKSRSDIRAALDSAVATGELQAPTGTAMSYMMSGGQYLHPDIGRWLPHLMIWMPYTTQDDWGPNRLAGDDPVVFRNPGGPYAMVVIPYGEERFIDPTLPAGE